MIYAYLALAAVQLESGQAEAGAESGRKALAMAEALDARRHSAESRSTLAMTLHRLVVLPGSPAEIRALARRSNAIFEAIDAEKHGGPMANAHSIALNHYNIGNTLFAERKLARSRRRVRIGRPGLRGGAPAGR